MGGEVVRQGEPTIVALANSWVIEVGQLTATPSG
jgi:hypothetical protein